MSVRINSSMLAVIDLALIFGIAAHASQASKFIYESKSGDNPKIDCARRRFRT